MEGYKHTLMSMLRNDGLIGVDEDFAEIEYKHGKMYVNGMKVSGSKEGFYCALNEQYDVNRKNNMTIEITPQNLSITHY